jgi:hypothetical protein
MEPPDSSSESRKTIAANVAAHGFATLTAQFCFEFR